MRDEDGVLPGGLELEAAVVSLAAVLAVDRRRPGTPPPPPLDRSASVDGVRVSRRRAAPLLGGDVARSWPVNESSTLAE